MEVDEILTQVIYGKTTEIIKENERKLDLIASENYGNLLLYLANYLSDESLDIHKRKLSATILKNMIAYFHPHKQKWITLDNSLKSQIKLNILSALASKSKDIIYSCGNTIAGNFSVI